MLPIILLPFYLKSLSVDEYGRIEIVVAAYSFLIIFGSLQLETALQRYLYKVDDRKTYFSNMLLVIGLLSIFVAGFCWFFSDQISLFLFGDIRSSKVIALGVANVILFNAATVGLIYLRYTGRGALFALITVVQVITTSAVTYLLVVAYNMASEGYFLGMLSGWFFIVVVLTFVLRKEMTLRFNIRDLKSSLEFSLPQLPARFGSFFMQFGSRFLVLHLFGLSVVATLSVSLKFAAVFQFIQIAFSMAWYPYLYKNESAPDLEEKINSVLVALLCFLSFSSVVTIYFGRFVVENMLSEEYQGVGDLIGLAIMPVQFLIIKEVLETGIKLSNRTKYISYAYVISVAVTIFGLLLSESVEGVMSSFMFGALALMAATWCFSEVLYKIRYMKAPLSIFLLGWFAVWINRVM